MYSMKTGLGGKGLQPFNETTGEYENISFSYDGKTITSIDDFRDSVLDQNKKEIYDKLPNNHPIKAKIDEYINNMYGQFLTEEVNNFNAKERHYNVKFFSTAQELVDNIDSLITPQFLNCVKEYNFSSTHTNIGYSSNYGMIPIFSVALQKSRYGTPIMRRMAKEDFLAIEESIGMKDAIQQICGRWGHEQEVWDELQKYDDIILYRGISGSQKEGNLSFFTDEKVRTLLGCGYFNSVIYMTPDYNYADRHGNINRGLVRNWKKLKVFKACERDGSMNSYTNAVNPYYADNNVTELKKILRSQNDIKDKISKKFIDIGISNDDVGSYVDEFVKRIENDTGFALMLFGYDAVYGEDHQFDILNPNICQIMEEQ